MMFSPLDPKSKQVKFYSDFKTKKIISLYRNQGIDVERFFSIPEVKLLKCIKTGYRFYYPFEIIGDEQFYVDLSKNRNNYYSKRWEHYQALKYIKEKDKILEVGSGFGAFLRILEKNKIKGFGLELNSHAVKECQIQGLNVKNKLIEEVAIEGLEKYDTLCFFQVLEHVPQVNKFLSSAIECLKPYGTLIIGVPNNNPYLFISDKYHTLNLPPHHAGLWDKKSLKSLEKLFPLKMIKMEFEPLSKTYATFLNIQLNYPNKVVRWSFKLLNRITPKLLKILCCKFLNGRNILVVFQKTM